MAYELIETIEVGSGGAASIEFTSIPQDGVDLLLVLSARGDSTSDGIDLQFNNDTGSNYSYVILTGNGSSVSTFSTTTTRLLMYNNNSGTTANTFSNNEVYISNYTASSAKSVSENLVWEDNATSAQQRLLAGKWDDTSAISSIKMTPSSPNFVEYSTASLYKIS